MDRRQNLPLHAASRRHSIPEDPEFACRIPLRTPCLPPRRPHALDQKDQATNRQLSPQSPNGLLPRRERIRPPSPKKLPTRLGPKSHLNRRSPRTRISIHRHPLDTGLAFAAPLTAGALGARRRRQCEVLASASTERSAISTASP